MSLDPHTYTVAEVERWSHLRAIEWQNFATFLAPLYAPFLVVAVGPWWTVVAVMALHLIWSFVIRPGITVNIKLSTAAALAVAWLKYPTCLTGAVIAYVTTGDLGLAAAAFVVPMVLQLLAGFVEIPFWWALGAISASRRHDLQTSAGIGTIQRQFLATLGYFVTDTPAAPPASGASPAQVATIAHPNPSASQPVLEGEEPLASIDLPQFNPTQQKRPPDDFDIWTGPGVQMSPGPCYEIRRPGMLGKKVTKGFIRTTTLRKGDDERSMLEVFTLTADNITLYDHRTALTRDVAALASGFAGMGWACEPVPEADVQHHLDLRGAIPARTVNFNNDSC